MSELSSLNGASAAITQQMQDNKPAEMPKGVSRVGNFFLNLMGKATSRQSQQLTDMRNYVKSELGESGVKSFDKWAEKNLSTKSHMGGWSSVMSDSDMKAFFTEHKLDGLVDHPRTIIAEMPQARQVILKFSMSEFSAENPIFLSKFNGMPIDEFAKDPAGFPNERLSEFDDALVFYMTDDFVGGGDNGKLGKAKFEVNVSHYQRRSTEKAKLNWDEARMRDPQNPDEVASAKKDLLKQLANCRDEITSLMNDTMGRLRKDDKAFNNLMKAMVLDQKYNDAVANDIIPGGLDEMRDNVGPLASPDFYNEAYEAAKAEYQEQQKALKEVGLVKSGW
ncbi:MAG: hypothetical protein AAGE61_06355 [Pseudomonadota bacterium]